MHFRRGRNVQLNKIAYQSIPLNLPIQDTKNRKQNNYYFHFFHQTIVLVTKSEKVVKYVIGRMDKKNMYYPIDVENITERNQWNRWFIIGW